VLFNTLAYAKFFAVVFVLTWLCARRPRLRLGVLVLASYVFYAHWDYRFVPLLLASSSIDFWLGRRIGASEDPGVRRRWLWATVLLNLAVLGTFKYLGFGVTAATDALAAAGFQVEPVVLEIALPVGISFFTFESMSYVIDVYHRRIPPHPSYLDYLGFVSFFPHLVAGPIVRPADLLPQLSRVRFDPAEGSRGLFLIAWGLVKKVAIGDTLGMNLVDRVFDAPASYSSLECYAAVVAYAVQIYCDFSGYTDVAIGSALLLGIRLPLNFDAPYKAVDVQDFWRRWHISLSTWLRDYLYIPLGGNRKGTIRTYINLIVTMLLGGLWHGASYNFVVWGGLHGAALALNRAVFGPERRAPTGVRRVVSVVLTFHFVCFAWIFFRAGTFDQARLLLSQLGELSTFHPNLHAEVLLVLGIGLVTHFLPESWYQRGQATFVRAPSWAQGLGLVAVAFLLSRMSSREAVPFVYFQF
jgi:D-alanyl-lipoteichoic acid acyltransferase DltB (MBOAT superfamily)